jgi:hypothetical protein
MVFTGITFNDEKAGYEQRRFTLKTLRDLGFGKQSMEKSIQDEVKELVEYFRYVHYKLYFCILQFTSEEANDHYLI